MDPVCLSLYEFLPYGYFIWSAKTQILVYRFVGTKIKHRIIEKIIYARQSIYWKRLN